MGSLFSFSLYSSIILSLLYLSYKWMMAGENQHTFNRVALWSIYAVALLALPVAEAAGDLLNVPAPVPAIGEIELGADEFDDMIVNYSGQIPVETTPIYLKVLLWVYVGGILLTLFQTLWIAMKLRRIISRGEVIEHGRFRIIVIDDNGIAPFSWLRYVVMSRSDWEENGEMILTHELQHLRLRHWFDLFFAQIVGILQWYNPAAWLMREELKAVHEYQADRAVINSGVGMRDYQMLLIKKAVGARFPSLANSLNHSKLKKRITMMYNSKNSTSRRLRGLALVPALAIGLLVTNIQAVASVISDFASAAMVDTSVDYAETDDAAPSVATLVDDKSSEKISNGQAASSAGKQEEVRNVVNKKPRFPGGEKKMMDYVMNHIQYPASAKKEGIQGMVIVQFVVKSDGNVGDVKIMRGIDKDLDAEAIRVIKTLPAFTPGEEDGKPVDVWYTFPVRFKLSTGGDATPTEAAAPVPAEKKPVAETSEMPKAPMSEPTGGVYTVVEKKPQFPGGEKALINYVASNIHYPESARNAGTQGKVIAQFVVKSDGAIGDVRIMRSVSKDLDAEAIRVIKSLPDFVPGELDGKPVSTWYVLPLSFKLAGDDEPAQHKETAKAFNVNKLMASDSIDVYVNGRPGTIDGLDPATIAKIDVIKDTPKPGVYIYLKERV
ncbi:MAG: M56 family metallopeptidase [Staphylococcus sp.]|nr:M56 family metallopeptidase [Staphylococcus sp.]